MRRIFNLFVMVFDMILQFFCAAIFVCYCYYYMVENCVYLLDKNLRKLSCLVKFILL